MCSSGSVDVWTWRELREESGRRALERRIRIGDLIRLRRGVYATGTTCDDACAAAKHGGSLGCESAARHLGIWTLGTDLLHVWMRDDRHHYDVPSDRCECVRHWDAGASALTFALPSVVRILCQIRGCRGDEAFFVAVESARRLNLIDARGLRRLHAMLDHHGRRLVEFSRSDSDSGLESLVRLRTRRHGWKVRTQVRIVGTGRVDLLIEDWMIIETDGKDNHAGFEHRHRDLVRDATAASWGHPTLRFDYAMVVHDWDAVERAILGLMRIRPPAA